MGPNLLFSLGRTFIACNEFQSGKVQNFALALEWSWDPLERLPVSLPSGFQNFRVVFQASRNAAGKLRPSNPF
jgi:hypothetical protein